MPGCTILIAEVMRFVPRRGKAENRSTIFPRISTLWGATAAQSGYRGLALLGIVGRLRFKGIENPLQPVTNIG
jgi:hypothetical protein